MELLSNPFLLLATIYIPVFCKADICPEGFEGVINDPNDCRLFIVCTNGKPATSVECTQGLYFNPRINYCDFPSNVIDCRGIDYVCPSGFDGVIRHPTDCQSYFVCTPGQPVSQQACPLEQRFNSVKEKCDSPDNVLDCLDSVTTEATTQYISSTVSIWDCPEGFDGLMRHPYDCQFYFVCIPGQPQTLIECPSGLVFNPESEECDFPENVPLCQQFVSSLVDQHISTTQLVGNDNDF